VQPQSETVWRQATKYKVPASRSLTKWTAPARISTTRSTTCGPSSSLRVCDLPAIGAEDNFDGVIDVVSQKAIVWGVGDVANEGLNFEVQDIPAALQPKATAP